MYNGNMGARASALIFFIILNFKCLYISDVNINNYYILKTKKSQKQK